MTTFVPKNSDLQGCVFYFDLEKEERGGPQKKFKDTESQALLDEDNTQT